MDLEAELASKETDSIRSERDSKFELKALGYEVKGRKQPPKRTVASRPLRKNKETFRANLHRLLDDLGLSAQEAARRFGFLWRTFRRISNDGVKTIDRRSRSGLQKIADEFHIDIEQLWDPSLPEKIALKRPSPERLASRKQSLYWPYAEKLLQVLEAGEHGYLMAQIDTLYALQLATKSGPINSGTFGGEDQDLADEEDLKSNRGFGKET